MKKWNVVRVILSSIALALGTGCATDPLTRLLRDNHYAPLVPVRARQDVGDLFNKVDLTSSAIGAREVLGETIVSNLMVAIENPVSLPIVSGDRKFAIRGSADVIGYAKADLEAQGIRTFRVKPGDAYQYQWSDFAIESNLMPKVQMAWPQKDLSGLFVVTAVLRVNSLEYEFFNGEGVKVAVESKGLIENVVKGKLGGDWIANENKNLSFVKPRFVGYRVSRIVQGRPDSSATRIWPFRLFTPLNWGATESVTLQKVTPDEVRRQLESR